MAKLTKSEFKKLVMKNFELIEGEDKIKSCEGAQLINGKWYMPLWGCDTIQNILDDIDDIDDANVSFME